MTTEAVPERDAAGERREESMWVAAIRSGDREAARNLCERYAPRVRAYARRRVADPERVKDVCQSAMLALLRGIRDRKLDDESRPGAYLFGACRHLVAGRPNREDPLDDLERFASGSDPEREVDQRMEVERIQSAIARLEPADREVLIERLGKGRSHNEIARIIHLPPPAARKRYERALKRLREILGVE